MTLTKNKEKIKSALGDEFMGHPGLTAVVDGQFGSTGKGVISALMAELFYDRVGQVLSNAGPKDRKSVV